MSTTKVTIEVGQAKMTELEVFCRQVRSRSQDNINSMRLLHGQGITSQTVAILRQEIDSMVRVIYLLATKDNLYREDLIKASVEGRKWTAKENKKKITDREMVDFASTLHGWTQAVYRFGCAFIHLSSFHDYKDRDPMDQISTDEKNEIVAYLRHYHGGPKGTIIKFNDVVPFLPAVLEKISLNLEYYIKELEAGKSI